MGAARKKTSSTLRNKNACAKFIPFFIVIVCIAAVLVNVTFFSPTLCLKASATDGTVATSPVVVHEGDDDNGIATTIDSDRVNELLSKLSQDTCTYKDITVRCFCGAATQPDYLKNMIETYAGSRYDQSLFEKCLNETLPFDANTPLECWPKMYSLSSYPTSGNELARSILQRMTKRNSFLSEYEERSTNVPGGGIQSNWYVLKAANNPLRIYTTNCDHSDKSRRAMPFGMMGKSTIYKTHGPKGRRWKNTDGQFTNYPKLGGYTTGGIIHLARNPGDQLLRDSFRWPNKSECHSHKCFMKNAHEFCEEARGRSLDWSIWHQFWMDKSMTTPHMIYHYENFSNTTRVTRATEAVMDFLNEPPPKQAGYSSLMDELDGVIKDPPYIHGTLMAKICGKDLAREMHIATKKVSEQLGYAFDDETATWSLQEYRPK